MDFSTMLRDRAKAGDADFQYCVGKSYYYGYGGIGENHAEAIKWYRLSAENGNKYAQFSLGVMFDIGLSVVGKNPGEAVKWYKLAATQGHAVAQNNLAFYLENGTEEDICEALRLYRLSSEQGYWRALLNLGNLYYNGTKVVRYLKMAKSYYERALKDAGFPDDPAMKDDIDSINENICKAKEAIAELKLKEEQAARAKRAEASFFAGIATIAKDKLEEEKTAPMEMRTEVFISYAHAEKDTARKEELKKHLSILKRIAKINIWDDEKIKAGEDWHDEIQEALSRAKVAVLLVSDNFFASDYIWRDELGPILQAHKDEGAEILWLLVSTCHYKKTAIAKIQCAHDPKHPLNSLSTEERDKVYTKLVERIEEIFDNTPA